MLSIKDAGFDYRQLKTYSGYCVDKEKLLKSASGGAAYALAEKVIMAGGLVFGVAYSSDFKRAEYKCVETVEDLKMLCGSKYCETAKEVLVNGNNESVYKVLKEKLEQGRLVLYFGLGCDIGAVRSLCKIKNIDTSRLYCVEILCHGPTFCNVQKQYIEEIEHKFRSKIVAFSVRYKKTGWIPSYIHAEFNNGKIYEIPFNESDYGMIFSRYSRKSCYNCFFRGGNHKGDLTLGDYWGLKNDMPEWNQDGVSIIFVQTDKGHELINMLDDSFHITETDTEFALENNPMYFRCRNQPADYDIFVKNFNEKGLRYAANHIDIGFIAGMKRTVKNILPGTLVKFIKRFMKEIKRRI